MKRSMYVRFEESFMRTHHNGNCSFARTRVILMYAIWGIEKKIKVDCESKWDLMMDFCDIAMKRYQRRWSLIQFDSSLHTVASALISVQNPYANSKESAAHAYSSCAERASIIYENGHLPARNWIASESRYFWRPKLSSAARAHESNFFYFLRILKDVNTLQQKKTAAQLCSWAFASQSYPLFSMIMTIL